MDRGQKQGYGSPKQTLEQQTRLKLYQSSVDMAEKPENENFKGVGLHNF